MAKQTRWTVILLGTAALMVGCAKDGAINRGDADRVQADRDAALPAKEPAINADTRFAAGQLAESSGDFANALTQYQAALKANPNHEPALFSLALLYSRQRQFSSAIETWNRYITATHFAAAGYSNLGFCYECAKRPADAETAYRKGIAKDPKNQPCRVNYGLMLARQGKLPEATAQLAAVLTPGEVHYDLASVFELQGKKDAARDEYRKALAADPNMSDAQSRLAALE
jgi:tetratricopeptide (TPR) repeat protein